MFINIFKPNLFSHGLKTETNGPYGVVVSIWDCGPQRPSSNLGTDPFNFFFFYIKKKKVFTNY